MCWGFGFTCILKLVCEYPALYFPKQSTLFGGLDFFLQMAVLYSCSLYLMVMLVMSVSMVIDEDSAQTMASKFLSYLKRILIYVLSDVIACI